jgi:hypothetical protein
MGEFLPKYKDMVRSKDRNVLKTHVIAFHGNPVVPHFTAKSKVDVERANEFRAVVRDMDGTSEA